jgi:hypothetical protein
MNLRTLLPIIALCLLRQLAVADDNELATEEPAPAIETAPPDPTDSGAAPRAKKKPPRFTVGYGLSMPFYIYTSSAGMVPTTHTTPDERLTVVQAVSVGYAIHPRVTLLAVGLFMNVVWVDQAMGKTGWAAGAIAPSALIRLWKGFSVSAGPLIWYRARFKNETDLGAQYSFGYSVPVGDSLRIRFAVNSPQSYVNRVTAATSLGAAAFYRF